MEALSIHHEAQRWAMTRVMTVLWRFRRLGSVVFLVMTRTVWQTPLNNIGLCRPMHWHWNRHRTLDEHACRL